MERTRHHRNRGALRSQRPYLGLNPFQGLELLNQKRELWLGLHAASTTSFALPPLTTRKSSHLRVLVREY
jgi:hypothetical protein